MQTHPKFSENLTTWYTNNARDLPWRKTSDPYKIWISEIMLQQTTVAAVIPYYERWIKRFPDIHSVARARANTILNMWQGLGYYSRARNIHQAAKIIKEKYAGQIPQNVETLKILPGFGPYTVGAVLSIAFNKREPIIDANVRRVVMRQLAEEGFADNSKDKLILNFLTAVMPYSENNIFNQALMELGALICRSQSPKCLICPVRESCISYKQGSQDRIPTPKKSVIHDVHASIAVIERNKTFYIQKRPPQGLFADLWEFPGGKIKEGESPENALYREVKEELGIDVQSARSFMQVQQYYTQFRAHLHVWMCSLNGDPPEDHTHRWVPLRQLTQYPMPSGSVRIVNKLLNLE